MMLNKTIKCLGYKTLFLSILYTGYQRSKRKIHYVEVFPFINLVTRDEITNSVPSSLNFISVNNIICCLDVDHLDDRCDVCAVVYF